MPISIGALRLWTAAILRDLWAAMALEEADCGARAGLSILNHSDLFILTQDRESGHLSDDAGSGACRQA